MPSPGPRPSRLRRAVRRTLITIVAGFTGLVVLALVLQACGAVPDTRSAATAPLKTTAATATPTTTTSAAPTPAPVAPQGLVSQKDVDPAASPVQPQAKVTSAAARPRATTAPKPVPAPKATPKPVPAPKPQPVAQPAPKPVTYANCDAVRAAGAAPLLRGQPGYSSKLDRDGDGKACEPTK